MTYQEWLQYMSNRAGRDVSQDAADYDLEGYYNSLKANPGQAGAYDPATKEAHLEDTYKLPNHPTFSDQSKYSIPGIQEGGKWEGTDEEGFEFTPTEHNLRNMPAERMQKYFNQVESPEALNLPNDKKFSKIREKMGKNGK